MQIRRFLKKVGIQSQREIENAVRSAVEAGSLAPGETLRANVHLTVSGVDIAVDISGDIELE